MLTEWTESNQIHFMITLILVNTKHYYDIHIIYCNEKNSY